MLPFQAELYRAIFPHHIAQSRTVLISRADDIRPYSSNRANGFLQRSYGKLFPQSYPHNRGLRKICRSKAWGSVNEGAHFVCVTEFAGSHNAAMANFFRITSHNRGLRKIVQDKAQGSGREGAYFVYATERTGSCNAAMANFFRITSHNRGLRKIVQDKAQGSGREGAYFVYATERTGSCNAVMGDFSAV